MTYAVTCSTCSVRREIAELEGVLDFQEEHRATRGERHVLEFELISERGDSAGERRASVREPGDED